MSPEQKKNIIDSAIDLLTNRDEKAAAAAAAAKAKAEADAKAAAEAAAAKAKADAEAEAKRKEEQAKLANETYQKTQAEMRAAKEAAEKAAADAILTTHKVVAGETLSGISQKYYKSATRESWMKIYEANKAVIGDNPGLIKAGQELKIPKQ